VYYNVELDRSTLNRMSVVPKIGDAGAPTHWRWDVADASKHAPRSPHVLSCQIWSF